MAVRALDARGPSGPRVVCGSRGPRVTSRSEDRDPDTPCESAAVGCTQARWRLPAACGSLAHAFPCTRTAPKPGASSCSPGRAIGSSESSAPTDRSSDLTAARSRPKRKPSPAGRAWWVAGRLRRGRPVRVRHRRSASIDAHLRARDTHRRSRSPWDRNGGDGYGLLAPRCKSRARGSAHGDDRGSTGRASAGRASCKTDMAVGARGGIALCDISSRAAARRGRRPSSARAARGQGRLEERPRGAGARRPLRRDRPHAAAVRSGNRSSHASPTRSGCSG